MVTDKYKIDLSKSEVKSQGTFQILLISSLGKGIKDCVELGVLEESWALAEDNLAGERSA